MIEKNKIDVFSEILENYEGRDKFLKLFTYTAKLATLFTKSPKTTDKFCQFGSKMSECRVILRLMDDIPILQATIAYGWGKQDPAGFSRYIKLLRNLIDLVASPVEHICWMGENKFIETNETFWDRSSTWLWNANLVLALLLSVAKLQKIECKRHRGSSTDLADNQQDSCQGDEEAGIDCEPWNDQFLTCLRLSLDLVFALNCLPSGPPWGFRLKLWQGGFLGTLSASIGIYQMYKKINVRSVTRC